MRSFRLSVSLTPKEGKWTGPKHPWTEQQLRDVLSELLSPLFWAEFMEIEEEKEGDEASDPL